MYRAELHVHTQLSDGTDTAEQVVALAQAAELTHLVITDHDTTARTEERVALIKQAGMASVTGIEISAYDFFRQKKVHILGYDYQDNSHIEPLCQPLLMRRHYNALTIIDILQGLGYDISLEKVAALTRKGCVYKQHILNYLVTTGQTDQLFGDAYRQHFSGGGACHLDIVYVDAAAAVAAIKADGGYAVLAHPGQQQNYRVVPELVAAGLDGIECHHPAHTPEVEERIRRLAARYGLFTTGGSDYHGGYDRRRPALGSFLAPADSQVMFTRVRQLF